MPFLPTLQGGETSRAVTDTFLGYNHRERIADGEFYDTKNLTTAHYPNLASRARRGVLSTSFTRLQAVIAKDALYWVDNGTLYANGSATGLTGLQTAKETQLVSMGAYICVFPDGKYINTKDLTDFGSMGATWNFTGTAVYSMCHADGSAFVSVTKSATEPTTPSNGAVWIDTTSGEAKEYSVYTESWTVLETVYTRIDFTTMGQIPALFKEYDGVQITGAYYPDLNGSKVLYAVGGDNSHADWIVVVGIAEETYTDTGASITAVRKIPSMDYVCEAQNRLWGCFYGHDGTQTLNEIYCCALGDFRNWEQYLGVSTDSWRASCGSDGPWTGCINYLGTPTFFKENRIHPVSVSSVGAHQISDIPARGTQQGSHKSLAVVGETLYYKSRTGVMAYQGGMPVEVSEPLGGVKYYQATAGVFGQRYYLSMKDGANAWHLFVYDAARGLWVREDELHAEGFTQLADDLYAISNNKIIALNGTAGTLEPTLQWMAESGIMTYEMPDKKYVSRFDVRLNMSPNAQARVFLEYDSDGVWRYCGTIRIKRTGTAVLPVRPRRCDHMRMRLEGTGEVKIYSITRVLEKGSDM